MTRSLWFRLLLGSVLGVILVQTAAGLTMYLVVRSRLHAEFDAALAKRLRTLAALIEQEGGEVEVEFDERLLPEWATPEQGEHVQVWASDGSVLYRSPSLGSHDLDRIGGGLDAPRFGSATLPDGRTARLAGAAFHPVQKHAMAATPREVTLVVARTTRGIERTLATLRIVLAAAWLGTAFLTAAVLDWIVSRSVRPVNDLAAQISEVSETGLSARVALDDAPTELAPVVERLNDLLSQLDAVFERQKSFTSNVAHELRTPLTGLLTTLELALTRDRTTDEYRDAIRRCHLVCSQMSAMVDNLLCLARAEAGQMTVTRGPVVVGELLRECWGPLAEQAEQRRLRVEWTLGRPRELLTDRELLRLILLNVLGNAVSHSDAGGSIRVRSLQREDNVEIAVTNSGSRLTEEQARQVCERFWQGDAARSATGVHCGLGLALCQTLMSLLGGRIHVTSAVGGEFAVTLSFPQAP